DRRRDRGRAGRAAARDRRASAAEPALAARRRPVCDLDRDRRGGRQGPRPAHRHRLARSARHRSGDRGAAEPARARRRRRGRPQGFVQGPAPGPARQDHDRQPGSHPTMSTTHPRSGDVAGVKLRYVAASDPITDDDSFRLHLPTDAVRSGSLVATLTRPGVARDALLTIADVLASDLRFKARDRADYLAYLIAQGKRVSNEVW